MVFTNVDTKQNLYHPPFGQECVPFGVLLRRASKSLALMGDDTVFGFDVDAGNFLTASSDLLTPLTTPRAAVRLGGLSIAGMSNNFFTGVAGEPFGIRFLDNSIEAEVVIDFFGYLRDL